ncbi:26666_t:CDS:2 [Dentiscutata erythropus]|uniref:26666_t:CDS:1 n=1 Tax=Dentiscutata erythropus TaxID=1348616 RepID=A0A9N8Z498_9GLOM|nr:26666_t:CDS:2 [Dentiscutata erythropus]
MDLERILKQVFNKKKLTEDIARKLFVIAYLKTALEELLLAQPHVKCLNASAWSACSNIKTELTK